MKILYIVSTLKRSGPTNQLYNLIKYLDRSRFEPHLVTLSPEEADSRWVDFEEIGVRLYALNLSRLAGFLLAKRKVIALLPKIRPDLIHTQGIRGDILSAALPVDLPRICTVRNFPQHDYPMTYGALQGKAMLRRHTNAMRALSICVGVSEAVAANLRKNFSVQNTTAIENGVDTEHYIPASGEEKAALRTSLSLPRDGRIWISSGHLAPRKDPLFLIEAWQNSLGNDASNHLVFIGDGQLRSECEALAVGADNIHVLGRVNNVADYLKASDYFVSASKAEGLPNAVLEALACGLPVLLSDIGPHREIWDMSRGVGALFPLDDAQTFTGSLLSFAGRDRQEMSSAAITLIADQLSAQKMSDAYQSQYSRLVEAL